ncbi:MAG: glucose 1-dehydrogenase [Syntrophomonadaceae bacterium]|nr:glucose 1-dehydrogenase [Syntrophomonadaceae bacterium]
MKLLDKVAIITGSGNGIGREIAKAFAKEGAKVVVSDYIAEAGIETTKMINEAGLEAIFVQADVAKEEDIENLIAATVEKYGTVDILVNNAGISGGLADLNDISIEDWDQVMAVNLRAPFLASKIAFREMSKKGQGNIINIGSMASLAAGRGGLPYTVSKHGVLGFTRQLSFMLGSRGIRVNAILPGPIDTDMIKRVLAIPEHPVCMKIGASPAGRAGQPEEIAKLAVFLASEDSAFIHGAAYEVDGGYTIF